MAGPRALAFIATTATTGEKRPRLALKSEYDSDDLDRLKEVMPKGKWVSRKLIWHWPLTTASCRKLRDVYGDRLIVRPELNSWYREEEAAQKARERERQQQIARAAREAEERAALAEERALYGKVAYSVSPFEGIGGGAPLKLPEEWLDIDRVPVDECSDIPTSLVNLPDPSKRLDMQLAGARWLVENGGGVLADEVGLGKSLTIITALLGSELATPGPHLIVAPLKVARATWPAEFAKWTSPGTVVLPEWAPGMSGAGWRQTRARSIAQCQQAAEGKGKRPVVLVVNHDALVQYRDWLQSITWAAVVVDEADQVLSVGHRGAGDTKIAQGLMGLRVRPDGLRIALSGTPFRGRLANAWGLIDFCRPGAVGKTRKEFASALTQKVAEEGGGATLDRVRTGMEREWSHLMSGWFLRRTRTAAQRALIERREEVVEPLPAQREQDEFWRRRELWAGEHVENDEYEKVDIDGKRSVMQNIETGLLVPDVIVAVSRRIQLSVGELVGTESPEEKVGYAGPSPKIDRLIEMLGEWGLLEDEWWWMAGEHGKVIIASPWTGGLDLVHDRLIQAGVHESGILRIDGKTSGRSLEKVVAEFTSPRGAGILLLSSQAGGAGLTLDQHCTRLVILSEHWIDDVQQQVIGRISNRTWETSREVVLMRTAGMLDTYLGHRTAHQRATSTSMLELARAGGGDD